MPGALLVRFPKQLDAAPGKSPGPLKSTSALAGSKLVPLMVSVNGWLAMAGVGWYRRSGVGGGELETIIVRPLETGHSPCCGWSR
jgi:hypothetical protein